ncbi:hypothetical protein AB0M87_04420 [Streptomyces sp. NPDC051320]|uniref:phage tail tube protein n=1 Tax=Streptomyces sp. NPDC051320 TaxID=3154644 RepID=UPI0034411C9C
MSATPITAAVRYYRRGVSKVQWVPTIGDKSAPTRAELDAGTELSPETGAVNGWQITSNTQDAPALGTTFNAKVFSTTEVGDSSLTIYVSKTGTDVRTLLIRGTTGFIVWMDEGDVAGSLMDVFPVQVMSQAKTRDIDALGQVEVQFSIPSEPAENVVIPA